MGCMENNSFKSVTFGGFAKQDVIDYIEKTARENAAVVEQLRKENASLQDELKEVKLQLEGALARLQGLTEEHEKVVADLAAECALRQELEPYKAQHAALTEENERMSAELQRMGPDAAAYAQFRERIGAIECEARKRAADLEEATQAQLRRSAETFRAQYDTLMNTFNAAAAHVTAELRKVEVNLTQLPRTMDRVSAELKELDKTLEKKD